MHRIPVLVACIACAGYGRRLQTSTEKAQDDPSVQMAALSAFLLAQGSPHAFNSPVGLSLRPNVRRVGHSTAQVPEAVDRPAEAVPAINDADEELRAQIRALDPDSNEEGEIQKKPFDPRKEDLDGINPLWLVAGSAIYGSIALFFGRLVNPILQGMENPMQFSSDYVERLYAFSMNMALAFSGFSLFTGGFASICQLGLALYITYGIIIGKFDMNKKREITPAGQKKMDKYKKYWTMMTGNWESYDFLNK
mmetsp:Transcript_33147/g.58469  ORF Transcript_33147/g.58469 Transcript_33147/m.58469 type:complete len:251 (-) Transcript_33147:34-786(-)